MEIKNKYKIRLKEIHKVANDKYPRELNYQSLFIEGAKWADEHLNLYNDEKYHTVRVSDLDELHRKANLYDEFINVLCKALNK